MESMKTNKQVFDEQSVKDSNIYSTDDLKKQLLNSKTFN